MQFLEGKTREEHDTTIGVEFGSKQVSVDGMKVKLQIWDTAGQENFRSIIRSYYRAAIGALLVYDVSSCDSFHHLQKWLQEIRENGNPGMSIMLCGNKMDKEEERFAKENGLMFQETSAKTGCNVEQSFDELSRQIVQKILDEQIDVQNDPGVKVGRQATTQIKQEQTVVLQTKQEVDKKCC